MRREVLAQESSRAEEIVLMAAGLADLVLSRVEKAAAQARDVLGRADLRELAQEGNDDLKKRGELRLRRYGGQGEPHLELLARRVVEREENRSRDDV